MSIEDMVTCLAAGEEVKIHGFGSFGRHDKAARPGRNPRALEAAPVAARRVVMLRASQVLKNRTAGSLPGGREGRRV